jgi:hypothetical protein
LVLDGLDKEKNLGNPELDRTLIRSVAGIRFNTDSHSDFLKFLDRHRAGPSNGVTLPLV